MSGQLEERNRERSAEERVESLFLPLRKETEGLRVERDAAKRIHRHDLPPVSRFTAGGTPASTRRQFCRGRETCIGHVRLSLLPILQKIHRYQLD